MEMLPLPVEHLGRVPKDKCRLLRALAASFRLKAQVPQVGMAATAKPPFGRQCRGMSAPTKANAKCRMGELEPWIDENFIRSLWFGMGEQVNVKMIRDKFTG